MVKLLENKVYIYGTSLWNHKSNGKHLVLGENISYNKFARLIDKARELHNPWTMASIADYLACVSVGSVIRVHGVDPSTGKRCFSRFEKTDIDIWYLRDSDNFITDMPMHSYQIDEAVLYYCRNGNFNIERR